jgi:hypothetical protein
MSTSSRVSPAVAGAHAAPVRSAPTIDRARRRALVVTSVITLAAVGLFADLLLVGHTSGEELWGPITAVATAVVGSLSLVFLAARGHNRAVRIGLIAGWLTIAFFGFGGYNSHRLPLPDGTVDSRPRPPLAPLIFTGMGIVGAFSLRSGTNGKGG